MRTSLLVIPVFIAPVLLFASQAQSEKWRRVYTSSESIIEIDISSVTFTANNVNHTINFGAPHTGRVKFRTVFSKPQLLDKNSSLGYKTSLETYEFRCDTDPRIIKSPAEPNNPPLRPIAYRLYAATFLGSDDKAIGHRQDVSDWKSIRSGNVMDKLGIAACALIENSRRTP